MHDEATTKLLDKYGLNFKNYSDVELRVHNFADIEEAAKAQYSSDRAITNIGKYLGFGRITARQNWVIIRQNEEIIRQNEQLAQQNAAIISLLQGNVSG